MQQPGLILDFRTLTVDGLRQRAENSAREANGKKEELRQYVGRRYRDLLRSADAIIEMKEQSKLAFNEISELTKTLNSLSKRTNLAKSASSNGSPEAIGDFQKKVDKVCTAPEIMWECMDSGKFTAACYCYFSSKLMYHSIIESAEERILSAEASIEVTNETGNDHGLYRAPGNASATIDNPQTSFNSTLANQLQAITQYAIQNWECVKKFPKKILQECRENLMNKDLSEERAHDILCAVAYASNPSMRHKEDSSDSDIIIITPGLTSVELLSLFLDARNSLIQFLFEAGAETVNALTSGTDDNASFSDDISLLLCQLLEDLVGCVVSTLRFTASMFVRKSSLSRSSQFFQAPKASHYDIIDKGKKIQYGDIGVPPITEVQAAIALWLKDVSQTFGSMLPNVFSNLPTGKDLRMINDVVLNKLRSSITGSNSSTDDMTWQDSLSTLFPLSPPQEDSKSTWKGISASVRGNEVATIWNLLISDAYCEQAQKIITESLTSLDIDTDLNEALQHIFPVANAGDRKAIDSGQAEIEAQEVTVVGDDDRASKTPLSSENIPWRDHRSWIKKLHARFNAKMKSTLDDLLNLLTESDTDILSLNKLIRFVLKPKIQSSLQRCISNLVKTMRNHLRDVDANSLDMDHCTYALSADKAVFFAQACKALAGFKNEVIMSEGTAHSSLSAGIRDRFVTGSLSTIAGGVGLSLLKVAHSGFRIWTRFLGTSLSNQTEKEFKVFLEEQQLDVNLRGTWKKIQPSNQQKMVSIPGIPSSYVLNVLLSMCTEFYRIIGPETQAGILTCAKIDITTQCSEILLGLLSMRNGSIEKLSNDTWSQILFDLYVFFEALGIPEIQVNSKHDSANLSSAFIVQNSAEEIKTCEGKKKLLLELVESKVDPIEFELIQKVMKKEVIEFQQNSRMLFGSIVAKAKSLPKRAARREKSEAVVRTVSLANPVDHIPLLPISLYPRKKSVLSSIRTPAVKRTYTPASTYAGQSQKFTQIQEQEVDVDEFETKNSSKIDRATSGFLDLVMGRISAPR